MRVPCVNDREKEIEYICMHKTNGEFTSNCTIVLILINENRFIYCYFALYFCLSLSLSLSRIFNVKLFYLRKPMMKKGKNLTCGMFK